MTTPSSSELKAAFRRRVGSLVAGIAAGERAAASAAAVELLSKRPEWHNARCIMLFAPMQDEVDIWPLLALGIAQGKTVALPSCDPLSNNYKCRAVRDPDRDVRVGRFGIREPSLDCPLLLGNSLDLALVPGVAFDLRGCRLGRGKGFYDRILLGIDGLKCGAVFDQRVVDEVPVEPHDIRVNCILTPTRWIDCGRHSSAAG